MAVVCAYMYRKCKREGDKHYATAFRIWFWLLLVSVVWSLVVHLWWRT